MDFVFWKRSWEGEILLDTIQHLSIKFTDRDSQMDFFIIAVYARCSTLERLKLWDSMESMAGEITKPWMIGGDFNVILNGEEKLGDLPVTTQEIMEFAQCLSSYNLQEIDYTCSSYTWWNGRIEEGSIFKRLDRVVANQEFFQLFLNNEVYHLGRMGSNHSPLHVLCKNNRKVITNLSDSLIFGSDTQNLRR